MSTLAFVRIPADTGAELEELAVPLGGTASALSKGVEGWYECICFPAEFDMWLNEEGKLEQLPHNPRAQRLWDRYFGPGTDWLVGPVVITGCVDEEGETLGLTPEQIASIREAVK